MFRQIDIDVCMLTVVGGIDGPIIINCRYERHVTTNYGAASLCVCHADVTSSCAL